MAGRRRRTGRRAGPGKDGRRGRTETPGRFDPVRSVRLALYHSHPPKLADVGLLGFGTDRNRVRYRNHPGVDELLGVHADLDGVRVD
ncbi:hypothetical protein ACKVMT_15250 [Halobacteriales archaeon Cl-PHB]